MKKITALILIIMIFTFTTEAFADPYSPYRDKYIEGYLKEISKDKVTIEEYDGTFHTINIMRNAVLKIDGLLVSPTDFKPGMEVYGELKGRTLKTLESFSTENPGYISPGKKIRAGIVKHIAPDYITIKLPSGEDENYTITPATLISRKGSIMPLTLLYEGDRVRLFFDEYNTNIVSRMAVEGDSVLVKGLYKGTLTFSDDLEDDIVLENIKELRNTKWEEYEKLSKLSYESSMPLYIGGQKIKKSNLKYYNGKEVYIAVKDFFGKNRIEKMVVKNNYEKIYTDKIENINWYSDALELNNKINFNLNEGTIIIKNGRLVDKYSVNPQSDVFLVSDGFTNPQANVLYIYNEDINNSAIGQNYLYYGRLDEIIDSNINLRNYSILDKHAWEYYRGSTSLCYDDDTYIYNMEENKLITSKDFEAGNYAVDEDSSYAKEKKLKDWYGYIYTFGDRTNVIAIKKDSDDLLRQRITLGTIKSIGKDPHVGDIIWLKDSRDWSNAKTGFIPKSKELRLMLDNALIVKGDKFISKDELQSGDRLYLVRDDFRCKFILVK